MKYTRAHVSAQAMSPVRPTPTSILLLLLVVPGLAPCAPAMADSDLPEKKLEALRERISRLEASIREDNQARQEHSAALRNAEKAAAEAARALAQTRQAREVSARRLAELSARRRQLQSDLERDREALGAEVRAAWLAGNQPRLKLVLSQQDPAGLGRMLAWYGYVARDRAERIGAARERLVELVRVVADVDAERRRLADLEARQAAELQAERAARDERSRVVAALDASLAESGAEVARLREEAQVLERLVEELHSAVVDLPVPQDGPFAAQRGKLAWPVSGVLVRDFGERRGKGPRSTGVLLGVPRGTEVKSVWPGRVAYADWLPGLGLLAILDHGDGYMSLYGHNEVLFTTVGDWVGQGEIIARAGDTGGREQAGLYFEIRRGRDAENPHRWFASRVSRAR
jgi:septal ring factor EnvC (AmiA/AmiB activator)